MCLINSLSNKQTSYIELVAVNSLILGSAMLKERFVANGKLNMAGKVVRSKKPRKHVVEYDRLDLLAPEKANELQADLRQRTGMPVSRIQVQTIDLKNDSATLNIWCDQLPAKDVHPA